MSSSSHVPPTEAGLAHEETPAAPEPAVTERSPFQPGLELGGRYRLITRIGRGGMGEVWEARHIALDRSVAIKLVLPNAGDRELPARLQREAELAAKLDHPNIVAVTDFGLVDARQPFVVMERLHGRPLSALIREQGQLPWTQARDIGAQIAAGLACAHRAGIVHRDLKPSNVFVLDDPHGNLRIKIIDFGLAKVTQLGPGERALTKSGAVFGTPGYMSPEQIRGEPLDGRADLYSLGVILYQLVTGEAPWNRGNMVQLLYSHLFEAAPTIRSRTVAVPTDFDALVARCLCKDRAMRPADADAVRLEIVGLGSGKGFTIVPEEMIPQPPPDVRARYAVAAARVAAAPAAAPASKRWVVPVAFGALALVAGIVTMQVVPRLRRADVPVEATTPAIEDEAPAVGTPPPPVVTPTPAPARKADDFMPTPAPRVVETPSIAETPSVAETPSEPPKSATKQRAKPRKPAEPTAVPSKPEEPPPPTKVDPPSTPKRKTETMDFPD